MTNVKQRVIRIMKHNFAIRNYVIQQLFLNQQNVQNNYI